MGRSSPTSLPSLPLLRVLLLLILAVLTASFVPPSFSSSSPCACDHHNQGEAKRTSRASSSPTTTTALASSSSFSSSSSPSSSSSEPTKTCRACLQQYKPSENNPTACHYHPGIYTGRLARIDDVDPTGAKDWFWSCCGEEREHGGCTQDQHRSFDEVVPWRSGFQ